MENLTEIQGPPDTVAAVLDKKSTEEKVELLVLYAKEISTDPRIEAYKKGLASALECAKEFEITDNKTKASASNTLGILKKFDKSVKAILKSKWDPIIDTKKAEAKRLAMFTDDAEKAAKILGEKLTTYLADEQIKLDLAAKKKQEEIRKEGEAKLEALQEEADESGVIDTSEQQEQIINKMSNDMNHAVKYVPKVKAKGELFNTSVRAVWKAEITNPEEALQWILEKFESRKKYLELKQTEFNSLARSRKKPYEKNDIRIYKTTSTVTR